jgi:SAM-dependent methyltransferase
MKVMERTLFDAYVKKSVPLALRETRLTFIVSQSLFSSHQIDIGTMHLLKTLESRLPRSAGKILDLGCGYGPIGLALGRLLPGSQVHLVDRDALALEFTRHNAALNEISDVSIYGSLGYDSVEDRDFDLIVSNIPGKAGDEVIRSLLNDARHYLAPGGTVAIVVVSPLEPLVLETLTHPDIEIVLHETLSAHTIFLYRFAPLTDKSDSPVDRAGRGLYDRDALAFDTADSMITMQTAHGLPEFDMLSFETTLLVKGLEEVELEHVNQAVVFHPGQGYVPVLVWQLLEPRVLHVVDRDLLALHYTKLNLLKKGCSESWIRTHHQVPLVPERGEIDLVAGVLREVEGPEAIEQTLMQTALSLAPEGQLLIAGGSTPLTRVLKSKGLAGHLRLLKRKRHKGNSMALFQRR